MSTRARLAQRPVADTSGITPERPLTRKFTPIALNPRSPSVVSRPPSDGESCSRYVGMVTISHGELIDLAASRLNPHQVGDRLFGDVASALISEGGNPYAGVCIDTGSGTGFCAEHAAIAALVTAGEYRIARIVAVWRDDDGALYVLPPCGRCREFIRQVDPSNINTTVVLARDRTASLSQLLPEHAWPEPIA